jgi:hypothetical protein
MTPLFRKRGEAEIKIAVGTSERRFAGEKDLVS